MADIKVIGVVGAGQMGNGIAHVAALAGYDVVMSDMAMAQAEKGLATITKNMARQVSKEKISQADMDAALARITLADNFDALKDVDLAVEAATENEAIKLSIFKELSEKVNKGAILASNTSSISITRLAAATDRPEKFMGMHFMNPVPLMKLVELIPGIATDDETFKAVEALAIKMGKTPVTSEDFPGFIANRILMPMINEAVYTLYEGVGTVKAIDTTLTLGMNHPMGPLTLADFIGLDTCLAIMNVLYEGMADSKYRPCPLLVKYVEAGWLGKKSGKGFYDYSGEVPVPTR
ncbi:MAG: 3-hydroxybutyryl-CoA dehydrogenase [Sphingomonadales bacterium]|nr:3-hydroxybutyryl-CoA dehydrogenase [Sphingomonadales bacterium]